MARKRKGKKKDNFASSIYKKTGTIILLIIVTGCCWYISRNREVLYPKQSKSRIPEDVLASTEIRLAKTAKTIIRRQIPYHIITNYVCQTG
ncbi:MAG: hypothetical protein ACLSG8_03840 [Barnesiella sp.]